MNITDEIKNGQAVIGIELGSTRIKAVLIGSDMKPAASGVYDWTNKLENGIWTYPESQIKEGVQHSFRDLQKNVKDLYGVPLTSAKSMGISAMMHGYLHLIRTISC